jgi:ribose transport system ATP-binding protein
MWNGLGRLERVLLACRASSRKKTMDAKGCLLQLRDVSKTYYMTKAIKNISLDINRGEILCLIGANGAGKSTLMRIVSGVTTPDAGGTIVFDGNTLDGTYSSKSANKAGIRVVYQELSLCTNLNVTENFYIDQHEAYKKDFNWRKNLARRAEEAIASVFPGSNISVNAKIGNLSLSNRQMVEIARATSTDGLKLLILDEPSSSLGAKETRQLIGYLRKMKEKGISIVFISHRLSEIVELADRIVVLCNGEKSWEGANKDIVEKDLVDKMIESTRLSDAQNGKKVIALTKADEEIFVSTENLTMNKLNGIDVSMHGGEIIGIAGLDGNGQGDFLKAIFYAKKGNKQLRKAGKICYVTGDRKKEGIFPLSDIADNMTINEINKFSYFKFLDLSYLAVRVKTWFKNLQIKAESDKQMMTSLSGGNQQKVLVARAFLSDADIIILDDPTKGVDVGTKEQMGLLFREAAAQGKLVIWYSTEDYEFEWCSRVLVFRYGKIVRELKDREIKKEAIITSSFEGDSLLDKSLSTKGKKLKIRSPVFIPVIALIAVFAISGLYQKNVFSEFGIDLLITGALPLVFAALAQMFVIGLSQIDLGVGALMGFINVICATIMFTNPGLGVMTLAGVIAVYGIMGVLIFVRQIPAVIVTLGMSFVWTGLAYTIQERPGGSSPEFVNKLFSSGSVIPTSVLYIIIGIAVGSLIYRSKYGTVLRGFGNNVTAVSNSGWSPVKAFALGYILSCVFSIVGGLAITASTGGCDANSTSSYTLLTVASVVIGGSELIGGIVYPSGTAIGAIMLSIISALLGFMRLNASWVTAMQGMILIVILASRLLRKNTA